MWVFYTHGMWEVSNQVDPIPAVCCALGAALAWYMFLRWSAKGCASDHKEHALDD